MTYEEAKARIAALEKDPKHKRDHDPERADRETRDDPVPTTAEQSVPLDKEWKRNEDGHWDHPKHRKEDDN